MQKVVQFVITKDTPLEKIVDRIEILPPLLLPSGPGPVACQTYWKTGHFMLLQGMRDETKMTQHGYAIGDRTWKRAYRQAMDDIRRYNKLTKAQQTECEAKGMEGIPDPDNSKYRSPVIELDDRTSGSKTTVKGCRKVRAPRYAILKAFSHIGDKHWHRYLFPFGCYFYEKSAGQNTESQSWKDWVADMIPSNGGASSSLLFGSSSTTASGGTCTGFSCVIFCTNKNGGWNPDSV